MRTGSIQILEWLEDKNGWCKICMKKEEETEFDNIGSHTLLLKELYLFTMG